MKVLIENYRGIEIHFDTDYEKFKSIVTDSKVKESKSFSAVIKWIDEYLKDNINFKSFRVEPVPNVGYRYGSPKGELNIVGVRKDGRFVYEDSNGEKHQLSNYDIADYMLIKESNKDLLDQLDISINKSKSIAADYKEEQESIIAKMDIITLKDHQSIYLK